MLFQLGTFFEIKYGIISHIRTPPEQELGTFFEIKYGIIKAQSIGIMS